MESKEDLEEKLRLYNSQVSQVEELLLVDPQNEQFLKLQSDLQQVIELTTTLLVQVLTHEGNVHRGTGHDGNDETNANTPDDDNDQYSLGDVDDDEDSLSGSTKPLKVGDRVDVTGGAHPFPGIVTGIISDTEYKVRYFAYEDEVTLPLTCLTRLSGSLHASDIHIGQTYQCKYNVDQQYYDVVIIAQTERGYVVTYVAYGNKEEVPLEYIRPVMSLSKAPTAIDSAKATDKKSSADEKKLIPIPAKLKILPTDSEEEKKRKQKKVKAIKNKNRLIEQDMESTQVAQTWQKFVHKKSNKRALSSIVLPAKTGSSMFSTSDDSASKVGVVNSGKRMTTFVERKKHKFEPVDE
ncbi:hypothetical protein EON64_02815 [archaeon]|nr:MAG: hypothetical protein EON64_02815 [archaeon]